MELSHYLEPYKERHHLCEIWSDEALDEFLEDHKKEKDGLTIYPTIEWAEKVKRNFIKALPLLKK